MHEIKQPLPVFRLQTGEVKINLISGSPQVWARIALMTSEGITLGDTTYTALSKESLELIEKLSKQIEKDFEQTLRSPNFKQWSEDLPEIEQEDIDYTKNNWEFT
jgi:hypothetical protein